VQMRRETAAHPVLVDTAPPAAPAPVVAHQLRREETLLRALVPVRKDPFAVALRERQAQVANECPRKRLPGAASARRRCHPPRVAAHEIGHLLTNQLLTGSEADGTDPGWASGGHYGGPNEQENLMRAALLTPGGGGGTKRLWNDPYHIVPQIDRLRASRFVR